MRSDRSPISWGTFTSEFLDELTMWIDGRRVLEVFAGNGLLAAELSKRGVDIKATSLFRSHDGHHEGMYFNVEEAEASEAVAKYGRDRDILLMSWPVAEETALISALKWGCDKPIIFIGEVTDYSKNHLGGCASDLFFELTAETSTFKSYNPRNVLERAAVRQVDRDAVLRVRKRSTEDNTSSMRMSIPGY